jgi:hypothetical protein
VRRKEKKNEIPEENVLVNSQVREMLVDLLGRKEREMVALFPLQAKNRELSLKENPIHQVVISLLAMNQEEKSRKEKRSKATSVALDYLAVT